MSDTNDPVREISHADARWFFLDDDDPQTDLMLMFRAIERIIHLSPDWQSVTALKVLYKAMNYAVQARTALDSDERAGHEDAVEKMLERAWFLAAGEDPEGHYPPE